MTLIHGSARQLLMPIYSRDQALCAAGLMSAALALCLAFDPAAAPFVMAGSWLGMWVSEARHAPVWAIVPASLGGRLVAILRDAGWTPEPDERRWIPSVRRWLRWSYVEIRLEPVGDSLRVTGPGSNVGRLLALAGQGQPVHDPPAP